MQIKWNKNKKNLSEKKNTNEAVFYFDVVFSWPFTVNTWS